MIRQLPFAAPFVYSVRGDSEISRRWRILRDRIKRVDVLLYRQIADLFATLFMGPGLAAVSGSDQRANQRRETANGIRIG